MLKITPVAPTDHYWSLPADSLLQQLSSSSTPIGLSAGEAAARRRAHGPNVLRESRELSRFSVFLNQVRSPLLLLLVVAAALSAATGEWIDALIVLVILGLSVAIGYRREYSAQRAAAALRARLKTRVQVLRDGQSVSLPVEQVRRICVRTAPSTTSPRRDVGMADALLK